MQGVNETDTFIVEGLNGVRKIKGTLTINGSKNDALQALPASLLFQSPLRLTNVPRIDDIEQMSSLLAHLGVVTTRQDNTLTLDSRELHGFRLDSAIAKKLRAF